MGKLEANCHSPRFTINRIFRVSVEPRVHAVVPSNLNVELERVVQGDGLDHLLGRCRVLACQLVRNLRSASRHPCHARLVVEVTI